MNGLINIVGFAIRNWRMTMSIMLFAVLGGVIAINRLALDAYPDVPVPFVNVRVVLPGISPEDGSRLLVRPMESELKSIDGLRQMDGISQSSAAVMVLEFSPSFDQAQAITDVTEKIDRARSEFPQDAEEPLIEELNSATFPIIVVNLFGDVPERELQQRAKQLKRLFEGIPAVLAANISGEREDVLEAVINPALVESLGITFDEISSAVASNNSLITAGTLETESGKFNVKLPGLIEDGGDLENLVIRTTPNGSIIRMKDIAEVRRGYKDVTTYARFNGRTSVSIEISKRQGENIILTEDTIRNLVTDVTARPDWPETINVTFSQVSSRYVYDMLGSLSSSIINAIILVFIVCIIALGIRSALFVGWAIPASFLMALFLFLVQGVSVNFMIMYGLILSVGLLVDSAIVIIEYADRKLAEGMGRREAYQTAGERMFWPIISSTATTLVAFLPLLFWNDVTGKFMAYMPRTVIVVLTGSMIMAIIFLPTMGTLLGPRKGKKVNANLAAVSGQGGDPSQTKGLTGLYVRFIRICIQHPIAVVLAALIVIYSITASFGAAMQTKPVAFFTQSPGDEVYVLGRARGNTTPGSDLDIALEMERRIANVEGIKSFYTIAGAGAGGSSGGGNLTGAGDVPSDTVVRIYTELLPFDDRPTTLEIMNDLRAAVKDMPGIFTEVVASDQGPPIGKDIAVQLSSENLETLRQVTRNVREKFDALPGLIEVEDTLPLPGVEWELEVDRAEAGRLGLDVARIGAAVQFITEGALVAQYRPLDADEEVDIRVRYPNDRRDLNQLDSLRILTPNGALPLSSVVKRIAKPRQDKITRRDQLIAYEIRANTGDGYATNRQVQIVKDWLNESGVIPENVETKFLGQEEENAAAGQFFMGAALAIIFMMGVILLLQFNSFYHVFLTLLAVVISVFGVIMGLIFYPYVSMVLCGTGMIALAGIVVNNNIVLIDTYQRLSQKGYAPADAALRTAAQRLRPVFLTTLTTIVGLMPLVMGWKADIFSGEFSTKGTSTSELWAPISYVIVCGLAFATLLTLILTPVLLAAPSVMKDGLTKWIRRKLAAPSPKTTPAE